MRPIHAAEFFDDRSLHGAAPNTRLLKFGEHQPGNLRLAVLGLVVPAIYCRRHASGQKHCLDVASPVEGVAADCTTAALTTSGMGSSTSANLTSWCDHDVTERAISPLTRCCRSHHHHGVLADTLMSSTSAVKPIIVTMLRTPTRTNGRQHPRRVRPARCDRRFQLAQEAGQLAYIQCPRSRRCGLHDQPLAPTWSRCRLQCQSGANRPPCEL